MITLGDVVFYTALVVLSGLSLWAAGVLVPLMFPARVATCVRSFEDSFWKTFFLGLVVGLPLTLFGLVLFQNPALRLFALLDLGAVIALAFLGSGGLTRVVASRIVASGGAKSEYEALAKGGMLIVMFSLLPVFGWLIVAPLVLVSSVGAGLKAAFRAQRTTEAPEAA